MHIARENRNTGGGQSSEATQTPGATSAVVDPGVSTALAALDLGASRRQTQKQLGDQGREQALLRDQGTVGGDGFLASFLKMVGGRETPREGQVVKGAQLGRELDLSRKEYEDIKVRFGGGAESATISFPSDFLEKIGVGGRVHLLVDTSKGPKVLETATRGKDGTFLFAENGGAYPKGCTVLIEPELSRMKNLRAAMPFVGGAINMHFPFAETSPT